MTTAPLLLIDARTPGSSEPIDLLLVDGVIAGIGPSGSLEADGAERVDLAGRTVHPGFWDAHVHFTQWVIRRQRIDLAGADSAAALLDIVRRELPGTGPALVGYGFRDGLWPDAPSRDALDAVTGDRPTVLISGDLHCAWLNSAAGRLLGTDIPDDGMLREKAWIGTLDVLDAATQPTMAEFVEAADAAAARGVVGIVDFENSDTRANWTARVAAGTTALRVEASVWPDRLETLIADGARTGDAVEASGLITVGRLKIVADGSLNTRTAFCCGVYPGLSEDDEHAHGVESFTPDEVERLVARADANGILPAVHAIGDRSNHEVLDVFARLGIPGTIEHAQLVAEADFARFGELGIIASVQPEHAMDDRDVADRHWDGWTDRAFAFKSLEDAGAVLHLGSDAPVAPLDPWFAISAAVSRSRDGRAPWHPEQRISRASALAAASRGRGTLGLGDPADVVVLDADPLTCDDATLREMPVAATLLGGRFTWNAL